MAIDNQIAECGTRQKVRPGLILVLSAIAYVSGTTACAASGANPERGVPDPGLPNSGLSDGGPPDTGLPSYFHVIGSMSTARSEYTATLLANGKVLVAGGVGSGGLALASAELYEPATGTFSPTGSLGTRRYRHTATLLFDGEVLIVGGFDDYDNLASAELYDPATGTFSPTGTMTTAREGHTATMLFNGKVFVAGGDNCDCPFGGCYGFASAELYDPATRSFGSTASMATARAGLTATLVPKESVLVTGGYDCLSDCCIGGSVLASAELYGLVTGVFSATGSMATARYGHTATQLLNGNVLVAGGSGSSGSLASAELYQAGTGTFSPNGSMVTRRHGHTATLLSDGKVLIAGGYGGFFLASAELYDPATGTFSAIGSMAAERYGHTATLLPSGSVLIAGGSGSTGTLASAELFDRRWLRSGLSRVPGRGSIYDDDN